MDLRDTDVIDKIQYIDDNLSDIDIILQLAEEAAELSQAASKYIRVKRGENPTPVTEDEAWQNLIEEFADVQVCYSVLFYPHQIITDEKVRNLIKYKLTRWKDRIENS